MRKAFNIAASIAMTLALAAPVHAQLLGGAIGGGLGVGGALGGATGSLGVAGSLAQDVEAPAVRAPVVARPAVAVPVVSRVNTVVAVPALVPAIPDVAVRRVAIVNAGIMPITYAEAPAYIDRQYVVLQNDLRGTGVEVIKRNNQIVLEMPSDVTFAFDKHDIQPRFYGVLDAVSRTLGKYPATYVDVNGHTDAIGSYAYNQRLSERRAGAVADYLADRSVNGARMHVQGFGKTEPIASNATISGRAANRRVEIILTPYAA
ncbi:outer membrane protein OmpA-like peptidoglycan-associated protein [Novosphingobium sp. 1748]|uniref:OmpA family protein n=1 Tax=unclassified Novosphingobium TaxID=2644732 RepID=UPI000ABCCAAE|nr:MULTISPECIES: OmpA family protein [unclassified Novosphingobium]MBN9143166.1 OmpA family protein [Novosphingobium sp.]MDR6706254.1 outer membrane protein OmpA-like peptidoglycan-associated protein [Novosphingobium sp. 1748]